VCADRIQLGRVFQNLVDNAIRCTPQGHKPPRVAARRRADAWEFTVTDHGIGVHDDDRERIFEPFERGPQAVTDGAGYGMGLAICRSIVERHGGRISVAATPKGGSRFSFTLPDSVPEAAIRAIPAGSFPTRLSTELCCGSSARLPTSACHQASRVAASGAATKVEPSSFRLDNFEAIPAPLEAHHEARRLSA
jgi:hypothetical protein